MVNLFEAQIVRNDTDAPEHFHGKVINAGYNFVLLHLQIAGLNYVFSIETFPQSDTQETIPPQATPVVDTDIPILENPPTRDEALEYWSSNTEKNADGTRKGGIFGSANFGLCGQIFLGDEIGFTVLETNYKCTIVQINSYSNDKSSMACKIKAYACQTPSKQAVVDTPNIVIMNDIFWVFVIARGLPKPTVDYPSTDKVKSIAIAGGGFINGNQTVQEAHDAETEEEGSKTTKDHVMKIITLPPRTAGFEEPRYCKFSFIGADGTIKKFGIDRGRINNIQVRYFGQLPELPTMYKAKDKTEVMAGFWMPVTEFIALPNDPTIPEGKYVPWVSHQAIIHDAVDKELARMFCFGEE